MHLFSSRSFTSSRKSAAPFTMSYDLFCAKTAMNFASVCFL